MTALTVAGFITGGLIGFWLSAILTIGKVTDLEQEIWTLRKRLYHLDPPDDGLDNWCTAVEEHA